MKRFPMFWLTVFALALVVALAAPVVAAETKGKIKAIENEKNAFVLTDTNNRDWMMNLHKDAKVFLNDKDAKLSDLKAGDEVQVTYDKEGDRLVVREIRCARK